MSDPQLIKLKNLGPQSCRWLAQVGLQRRSELAACGAIEAYCRVRQTGFKPSLNRLYALEGALRDLHWQVLPEPVRHALIIAAAAAKLEPSS